MRALRERNFSSWAILAIVILVAINVPWPVARRLKSTVREGLAPLQQIFLDFTHGTRETISGVRELSNLALEYRRQSEELITLRNEILTLKALEQENMRLRRALRFQQAARQQRLVACEVIARDISGWWHTIRLDKGERSGIVVDKAVITSEGLIGKVISVTPQTADVLILPDANCRISACIEQGGPHGIVLGKGIRKTGQPICRMEFINKNAPVESGDEVTTSGMGGVFPKDLLIGHIEKVYKDTFGLYQSADVMPTANLGDIRVVFVILDDERMPDEMERGENTSSDHYGRTGMLLLSRALPCPPFLDEGMLGDFRFCETS